MPSSTSAVVESLELRLFLSATDLDDQFAEAAALGKLEVSSGSATRTEKIVAAPTDVDMYSLSVATGERIGFDIDTATNGDPGLGSYLRVFTSAGVELAANNDAKAPREATVGFDSYIDYTFTAGGTYFVAVSSWQNRGYDAVTGLGDYSSSPWGTGTYTLRVTPIATPPVNLKATDGRYAKLIKVTWDNLGNNFLYDVWRSTEKVVTAAVKIAKNVKGAVFKDTAVQAVKKYYYWVTGTRSGISSGFQNADAGFAKGSSLDIRSLKENTDTPYKPGYTHLGSDFNSKHDVAGDVGQLVVSPVTGSVVHFAPYAGYGDLLVAIETHAPGRTKLKREDGRTAGVTSQHITVFLGHLSARRWLTNENEQKDAAPINLKVGDKVEAGVTPIGYIAPDGGHNGWVHPHVHVGVLPYAYSVSAERIQFISDPDPKTGKVSQTAFPGMWRVADPHLKDVRSVLVKPNEIDWGLFDT